MKITSTKNEYIKEIKSLKNKKNRTELGKFIAEGEKCVSEAIKHAEVECVLTTNPDKYAFQNTIEVSQAVLEAVSDTKTPQDAVCVVKKRSWNMPEGGFIVALDGVSDPQNVGTILRTADAAGASAVLVSKETADITSPKCVRASMGAVFFMPVIECDLNETLKKLKEEGYVVVAGHLKGKSELPRAEKTVLVIGNEARGVSNDISELCDVLYRINIFGQSESLNAAVAAGILMYRIKEGY